MAKSNIDWTPIIILGGAGFIAYKMGLFSVAQGIGDVTGGFGNIVKSGGNLIGDIENDVAKGIQGVGDDLNNFLHPGINAQLKAQQEAEANKISTTYNPHANDLLNAVAQKTGTYDITTGVYISPSGQGFSYAKAPAGAIPVMPGVSVKTYPSNSNTSTTQATPKMAVQTNTPLLNMMSNNKIAVTPAKIQTTPATNTHGSVSWLHFLTGGIL
jgi:hypothetical protein